MSKQEEVARGINSRKPTKARYNNAQFISFNPTKEELNSLKVLSDTPVEVYRAIEEILATSITIQLQGSPDEGYYKALVYDKNVDFQDRTYVTMFASTCFRVMCMLAFTWRQGMLSYDKAMIYTRQLELVF